MKRLIPKCLIITSACSMAAYANQAVIDPFDLSLEQLDKLTVSVSSHYQQSLQVTPGIVRLITKETIENQGWKTLQQVLMHIPGVQISISKNGHSNIWMRGVQNRNNNKVLLLIDGVPQHDHYYGNFHINHQIPLHQVEKIEVLNGPGGVVHGANSFAGVIAITTRSKGHRLGGTLGQQKSYSSAASSEGTSAYEVFTDYDWDTDLGNVYFFASKLAQEGFQPQYNRSGEYYDRTTRIDRTYLLGKYTHKNGHVQMSYSDYQYPYLYTKADRWQGYDKQLFTTSANYHFKTSSSLELSLSGFFKHYDFRRPKTFYDDDRIEASGQSLHNTASQGIDSTLLWPISDYRHLTFGFSYTQDHARDSFEENTDFELNTDPVTTKENSLVEDTTHEVFGLFSEFQQKVFLDHWLHLGVRHDLLTGFEDQSSYRISLTKETDSFYHKMLFGTSYRVPSYREYLKKYNDTYDQANPLQPEQIHTLELAIGYTPQGHEFLLVWYMNHYNKFIKEVTVNSVNGSDINSGDGDEYGFNFDQIDISGLELSWKWMPVKNVTLTTSVSHLLEATEDPGTLTENIVSPSTISDKKTDLLFLSDTTLSLQLSYQLNTHYSAYWDAVYYSDRPAPDNYQTSSSIQAASNANSVVHSNVHFQYANQKGLTLSLGINNVFDTDNYSPNLDPASDYDNQWPKRHMEFNVVWSY